MKTHVLFVMIILGCVMTSKGQTPKGELYWVVESNRNIPDMSVVKIYNTENILIHEVKLNTRIDVRKRSHRKALVRIVKEQYSRVNDGKTFSPNTRVATRVTM
ncbi:MAG TPA: hypothetical protein VGD40_17735 [Chryseosolibacter sp.]